MVDSLTRIFNLQREGSQCSVHADMGLEWNWYIHVQEMHMVEKENFFSLLQMAVNQLL